MLRGIFAKKLGTTQIFLEDATAEGVSVVEVEPGVVLEIKEYPGKKVAKMGFREETKEKKFKKPLLGYFKKLNSPYMKMVKEIELVSEEIPEAGRKIGIEIFNEHDKVDVIGISKGKGFQGGMRRHNWAGQPGSHGSTTHRRVGSVGASAYPSRIVKGKTMPGHMGAKRVTVRNLEILRIDQGKNLIFIKGSIPGSKNSMVFIRRKT